MIMSKKLPYPNTTILSVDFAKIERAVVSLGISINQADKNLRPFNVLWQHGNSWFQNWIKPKPTLNLNLRRLPSSTMTTKEIKIQKALGTLPYKEWMKIYNILFEGEWWYFPIPKTMKCKDKTITIDNIDHYPVADGYISDLQYSMAHNRWSEEHFAKEIIAQCYSCMGLMEIDH